MGLGRKMLRRAERAGILSTACYVSSACHRPRPYSRELCPAFYPPSRRERTDGLTATVWHDQHSLVRIDARPVPRACTRSMHSGTLLRAGYLSRERRTVPLTKLSQGQAARAAGVSRTTIWRAMKDGRLSYDKGPDGSFHIDLSELVRVFPEANM